MRCSRLTAVVVVVIASIMVLAASADVRAATRASCRTVDLVVWLDTQPNHTAGSTYYALKLTNLSAHACTLRGYPGISARALGGRELGSAASRNPAHPSRRVALAPGATATAVLQITDAHNFPPATCRPVTAARLRVYLPGATASRLVPFPFLACARPGPVYLHVEAVTSG